MIYGFFSLSLLDNVEGPSSGISGSTKHALVLISSTTAIVSTSSGTGLMILREVDDEPVCGCRDDVEGVEEDEWGM